MEIIINRDLRKFETKDIGNFTFKQIGFMVAGIAIALLSFALQRKYTGDWDINLCVIPAIPVLVLGFLKIKGMTVPEYIRTVMPEKMLMPKSLKWESDFEYTEDTAKEIFGKDFEKIPILTEEEPVKKGKKTKNK